MAIKITREFAPGDRYAYDFGPLTYGNGWAQIDTDQDASYYGNWCNPFRLALFAYCEGDTTLTECDTPEEFAGQLAEFDKWNREHRGDRIKIDPGFTDREDGQRMVARFVEVGAGQFLHVPA